MEGRSLLNTNHSGSGVFLTYAAHRSGDGFGAQAQRLMGIFSASRKLGFGYIHSEIQQIERNPGDPHATPIERAAYLHAVNALFELPSATLIKPARRWALGNLCNRNIFLLRQIHRVTKVLGIPVVFELPYSLPWSDAHPNSYRVAANEVRPRIQECDEGGTVRIDVHIRRALAPEFGNSGQAYDRYVSTDWYQEVIGVVVNFLQEMQRPYEILIHTDIPRTRWKVPEDTSPGTLAMWKHHDLFDKEGYLVNEGEDLQEAFSGFGTVEIAREWDPIDAMKSMVNADVLLICASSLSYVAGLLRDENLTVAPQFFHTSPTSWQTISSEMSDHERASLLHELSLQFE